MSAYVTREQLLASVHELRPGDLLVVRVTRATDGGEFDRLGRTLDRRLEGTGVRTLLLGPDATLEHWRRVEEVGQQATGP